MSEEAKEGSGTPRRRRLTPIDVQQQVFRRAMFRGYNEQDVDDFLDEVTEELALLLEEYRRLKEGGAATQPLGGGPELADAKRMADEIVRRAREEAAEILRKARTGAAGSGGGDTSVLQPFLAQERVFLQDLSKLIQSHADTVRDMARARRRGPASSGQQPAPASGSSEEGASGQDRSSQGGESSPSGGWYQPAKAREAEGT